MLPSQQPVPRQTKSLKGLNGSSLSNHRFFSSATRFMAKRSSEWNIPDIDTTPNMPGTPPPKLRKKVRILYGFQRSISSSSSEQTSSPKPNSSSSYGSKTSSSYISLASGSISSTQSPSSLSSPSAGSLSSVDPTFLSPASIEVKENGPLAAEKRENFFSFKKANHLLDQPLIPEKLRDETSVSSDALSLKISQQVTFDFWAEMPHEIALQIFAQLKPKELVRASAVSKRFRELCYDGQLWTTFDASEFYTEITCNSIAKILKAANPFIKDLNLRGCVQLEYDRCTDVLPNVCNNLNHLTLEGCRNLSSSTIHDLFRVNNKLMTLNLTGLATVTNTTCKIISQSCPCLEMLNISWCTQIDSRGLRMIVQECKQLKDLRVGEIKGLGASEFAQDLFETNKLERFVIAGCIDFTDQALRILMQGTDPEIDILTNIPLVPARRLRHLNMSRCQRITDSGIKALAHLTPNLQGLQLSGCGRISNDGLSSVIATTPSLTHLELDEIFGLTNAFFVKLSQSPCAPHLERLSISYCEEVGDDGMLPVFQACTSLKSVDMDNTKISDLILTEAASMVHSRREIVNIDKNDPFIGLRLVVYDCPNVTLTGVRRILSHNLAVSKPSTDGVVNNTELIGLKCFFRWQNTVDEHTKRLLKKKIAGADNLEKLWSNWMMVSGNNGNAERGLRRAREAQLMHVDDESGTTQRHRRRRRAWSSGCTIM